MLTDVVIYGDPSLLPLPFAQLTRLRIQIPQSPEHLRLAQNLIHLTLEGQTTLPTPSIPIELPRLRQLFLADGQYLRSLVLPALEDIYISRDVSSLPHFIDRSACRLKKLTIGVCAQDSDYIVPNMDGVQDVMDIIPILNHASTLREMCLCVTFDLDVLLTLLTVRSDSTPHVLCPELAFLSLFSLKKTRYSDEEYSSVVQMVDSRRNTPLCSPVFLSVLSPAAHLIRSLAATRPELKPHIAWLIGGRANEQFQTWRDHYPGQ
ncbi:hypothetical protein C8R44DRAFT_757663 [Mycena epipterygia]|nr:hypothetical protein C8R44DRAFT_757663 [Mycena epipterygia]